MYYVVVLLQSVHQLVYLFVLHNETCFQNQLFTYLCNPSGMTTVHYSSYLCLIVTISVFLSVLFSSILYPHQGALFYWGALRTPKLQS